MAPIKQNLLA